MGDEKLRVSTATQLEVQGLVSALMLSVAGSGLFAEPDLDDGLYRTTAVISFCVSVFCFMSAAFT